MRNRGLLIAGVVMLVVGVVGLAVTPYLVVSLSTTGTGQYSSAGQRIYYTGVGDDGSPLPRTGVGTGTMGFGMMAGAVCVDCHQQDGRGGRIAMMMWTFDVPDIRYSTLSTARVEDGEKIPAWTDAEIGRAIRDGVEPNGQHLKAPMARWDMTDGEIDEIIAYLKELSTR